MWCKCFGSKLSSLWCHFGRWSCTGPMCSCRIFLQRLSCSMDVIRKALFKTLSLDFSCASVNTNGVLRWSSDGVHVSVMVSVSVKRWRIQLAIESRSCFKDFQLHLCQLNCNENSDRTVWAERWTSEEDGQLPSYAHAKKNEVHNASYAGFPREVSLRNYFSSDYFPRVWT